MGVILVINFGPGEQVLISQDLMRVPLDSKLVIAFDEFEPYLGATI